MLRLHRGPVQEFIRPSESLTCTRQEAEAEEVNALDKSVDNVQIVTP